VWVSEAVAFIDVLARELDSVTLLSWGAQVGRAQKTLNRRQCRWLELLSRFSNKLLYVPGDKNVCADALSRLQAPPGALPASLPVAFGHIPPLPG
jgi:hypothetical protein